METMITIATILNMYFSAVASSESPYVYNAEMTDGILTTMYVYTREGENLDRHLRYDFSYDAHGRLTQKTVCRWSRRHVDWRPAYQLALQYTDVGYELARCDWDRRTSTWREPMEKMVYSYDQDRLVAVNYLRRSVGNGEFRSVDCLLVGDAYDGLLLATAR